MSKSYNNTIMLTEPEAEVRAKLKTMVTDPARIRRTDPGNPDICPVFDLHKVFSTRGDPSQGPPGLHAPRASAVSSAKVGSADAIVSVITPIQERRRVLEADPDNVDAILWDGSARARRRAIQTLQHVRQAMGLE